MVHMKKLIISTFLLFTSHFVTFAQFQLNPTDTILQHNYTNALFLTSQYFVTSLFPLGANFSNAQFKAYAEFNESIFGAEANFSDAHFYNNSYFHTTLFQGGADFSAEFDSLVVFTFAQFDQPAFFITYFHDDAHFNYSIFNSSAVFRQTIFDSLANFSYAEFTGELVFSVKKLPKTLDFSNIKTREIIDLTVAGDNQQKASDHICYINLIDSPIDKFKLRYDIFRVWKPEIITPENYEQLTNVYEGLSKNFKDNGYLTSLETLDKEYQEFKFTQNPNDGTVQRAIGFIFNGINKHWNEYGYDKSRIWLWTLSFFLLFTFINWVRLTHLSTRVYSIKAITEILKSRQMVTGQKGEKPKNKKPFNFRGFDQALFYTGLIFFGFKLNTENFNFDAKRGVAYIFIQYIVGLICLAYLANFVISSQLIGS
jgi:hypothetical protein